MANYSMKCPKLPWMINFHCSSDGKIPNSQRKAAFAKNRLSYLSHLTVKSQTPHARLTSILCTIGPSCQTEDMLQSMMEAGMCAVRIKMAHYDHEQAQNIIETVRNASDKYSKKIGRIYPVAIILELKGPEIRTGTLSHPEQQSIALLYGTSVTITTDPIYKEHVTEEIIYIDYPDIAEVVEQCDQIYFGNGNVRMCICEIDKTGIHATVTLAGQISSNTVVRFPGVPIDLPDVSEKDESDLIFAIEQDVDALIIGGLKRADPLNGINKILGKDGQSILIISKIDNSQAVEEIDEIMKHSDGILVNIGALGTEYPPEKLFLIQKSLIAKANKIGKPIISGANVLQTLVTNKLPSKSEYSDIANSIIDGADCIILSQETSIGLYPLHAVGILDSICKEAEAAVYQRQVFLDLADDTKSLEPIYSLAIAVTEASLKCNAAAIIVTTTSGRSAKVISQYKPRCPIIAITRYGHIARKLHLYRGVDPIHYIKPLKEDFTEDISDRVQLAITWGKLTGLIRASDAIIVVTGTRPGAGFTNSMKILYASEFDACNCDE